MLLGDSNLGKDMSSVSGGPDGGLLDTADSNSVNSGDLNVSLVSPGGSPGVSDEVVLLAVLNSVSDGSDSVVELSSAGGGVEDSASVHLEDRSVGLNSDGGGSGSNGGLELGDGLGGDGGNLGNVNLTLGGVGLASLGSGSVGVVGLELLSVGLGVSEGVGLPSTVASVGGSVAVDELLLGEGEEGSGLDEVVSLNGGGGGEGPAGTALSLVLDGVDGTLGSPVNGVSEVVGGEDGGLGELSVGGGLVSEESLVLEVGPGGEHVVLEDKGVLGGVDLLDFGVGLGEEVESEVVLLLGSVGKSPLGDVLDEGLLGLEGNGLLADISKSHHGKGSTKCVHLFTKLIINYKNRCLLP